MQLIFTRAIRDAAAAETENRPCPMRAEAIICIIISRGCYSRSRRNDNVRSSIGLQCNYYCWSFTSSFVSAINVK